jgi:hypothetical protein
MRTDRRRERERETDMMKLIIDFHSFANALKKRERMWFDDDSPNLGNEAKLSKLQCPLSEPDKAN